MTFLDDYFSIASRTLKSLQVSQIELTVQLLKKVRESKGRVFVFGLGGSAANSSHMVNDLRKICQIDAYSPIDNISEFSASCNDEGLGSYFPRWLTTSNVTSNDAIFVLSVGGGSPDLNISLELVNAINTAKQHNAKILGIVGRDGGYASKNSDQIILIPSMDPNLDTAMVESFQALIWHSLVFHPDLQVNQAKWVSAVKK